MLSKVKGFTLLISFVLTIYLMRNAEVSPGHFLKKQVLRVLDQHPLSSQFCPDVDTDITYPKSTRDRSHGYRSNIAGIRPDDKTLTARIIKQEPKEDFMSNYIGSIIPLIVAWIVLFGVGLVGCIYCISNWFYMNVSCCKKSNSRTIQVIRDRVLRSCFCFDMKKSNEPPKWLVITTGVIIAFTFMAGIATLVVSATIPKKGETAVCALIRLTENSLYGVEADNWNGIGPGVKGAEALLAGIKATTEGMGSMSEIDTVLKPLGVAIAADIGKLGGIYGTRQLPRIDPAQSSPYSPAYLASIGDPTNPTPGTLSGILIEFGILESQIGVPLKQFGASIQPGIENLIKDTAKPIPDLLLVSNFVEAMIDDPESYDMIKFMVNAVGGLIIAASTCDFLIAILTLLAMYGIHKGYKHSVKAMNFAWCSMGLMMLIAWAMSSVTFLVSVAIAEVCDAGDQALEDPVFFMQTADQMYRVMDVHDKAGFNKTRDLFYKCIHGSGDMSELFNIKNNLEVFDIAFDGLKGIKTNVIPVIQQLKGSPELITYVTNLNAYKAGTKADSTQTESDMTTLNSKTNPSSCGNVKDKWVLNSADCTSSATSFPAKAADSYRLGTDTCIGADVWIKNENTIANRYSDALLTDCTNSEPANFQNHITKLVDNRAKSDTLIGEIQAELATGVQAHIAKFDGVLTGLEQGLTGVDMAILAIYDGLTNEKTGMIATSQCGYMETAIHEALDTVCIGLEIKLYQTAIAVIILSFMSSFGTLAIFALTKKINSLNMSLFPQKKYYSNVNAKVDKVETEAINHINKVETQPANENAQE